MERKIEKRNYLVVIHNKTIDIMEYEYFETIEQVKEYKKEYCNPKRKIIHIYKVEEVRI